MGGQRSGILLRQEIRVVNIFPPVFVILRMFKFLHEG